MSAVELKGFKQTVNELRRAGIKVEKKILRQAMREAAKHVLAAVRADATSMVGGAMGALLAKSMEVRAMPRRYVKKWQVGLAVQHSHKYNAQLQYHAKFAKVQTGKNKGKGVQSYIPAAIEFGHAGPYDARGPKVTAAIPYFRSAWNASKRGALKTATRGIAKRLRHMYPTSRKPAA